MLGDEGEVLAGQLVLERLGRGGHHHPALGQQRGHQVGEALAGAGAGLHHQVPAVLDGGGDGDGHRALTGPGLAATGQLGHHALEGGVDAWLGLASRSHRGDGTGRGGRGRPRSRAGRPSPAVTSPR